MTFAPVSFALGLVIAVFTGCGARQANRWTSLEVDGATLGVPEGWRLEWSGRMGVKWSFLLYQNQQQRLVEIVGADLTGLGDARTWLAWFANRVDGRDSPLDYREYTDGSGVVVCAQRGAQRVFAACLRQPDTGEPKASAAAFVLNGKRKLFDGRGELTFLAELASQAKDFDYILCVWARGNPPGPGCSKR